MNGARMLVGLVALLASFHLAAAAHSADLPRPAYLLDGTQLTASSARLAEDWTLQFAGREPALPAAELAYWGAMVENLHQPQIVLADGSRIVADVLEITPQHVIIGTSESNYTVGSIWQRAEVPRRMVRGIVYRAGTEPALRDRLIEQLRAGGTQDQAWLENGDRVTGSWQGPFQADALADSAQAWNWNVGQRELTLVRDQVLAIALAGPAAASMDSSPRAVLGFAEGSRLAVNELQISDSAVRFRLSGGVELVTTPGMAWDELCYVRPLHERVVYLSDVEPLGYRHVPQLTLEWPYGRDRNVLQQWLRTSMGLHEKGLGVHSTARLAYDVPAGARRLQFELALDRSAGSRGSVQVRVYAQRGSSEWQQIAASPIVRGGEPPRPLDVDLAGAERVALIVDAADQGQELDRANLLYARVVR